MSFLIPPPANNPLSFLFNGQSVNSDVMQFGPASSDRHVVIIGPAVTPCRINGVAATLIVSRHATVQEPPRAFNASLGIFIAKVPDGTSGPVTFNGLTGQALASSYSIYGMQRDTPFDADSAVATAVGPGTGVALEMFVPAGGILIAGGLCYRYPQGGGNKAVWLSGVVEDADIVVTKGGKSYVTMSCASQSYKDTTAVRADVDYEGVPKYRFSVGASFGNF